MTSTARARGRRRPTGVGTVVAVLAATGAVGLLASGSEQLLAIALEVAGIAVLALGAAVVRRGLRSLGIGVGVVGAGVVAVALRFGFVLPSRVPEQFVLLAGMLGIAVFALGLLPVRAGWSRRLVTLGAAVVGFAALVAGALDQTSTVSLFAAVTAAMIAWDAADHAIGLGEHVGRDADSAAVELVHSGASTVVGATAVGIALGATSVEAIDLPLSGLVLLLAAALVLMLALYR